MDQGCALDFESGGFLETALLESTYVGRKYRSEVVIVPLTAQLLDG